MIRSIIIFISTFVTVTAFPQSQSDRLKKLTDSLSEVNLLNQQKINQFKSARTSNWASDELITDIHNGQPVYRSILNANAALTTGASKLQSGINGLNLEGKGIVFGVWDDGKARNHIELGNRIISSEGTSFQTHTTHVTGTLIATGINPAAKGMAPQANVSSWYFDNDEAELAAQARTDQTTLLFSNHSYGQVTGWRRENGWKWSGDPGISADEDFYFGFYSDRAKVIDEIVYLAPYSTIVWAAGNDRAETGDGTHPPDCNKGTGYDCIIPDAVGKNIITVGAADKVLSYSGPASVLMSSFSSWGPTDDGRIKPDLVGDGVNLFSLSAGGVNTYTTSSGTSMATPNVTGSLALLQELYSKLHGGNRMKAATLKALAIHSAKEAGSFPGPDYSFGWGLLDVEAGAKILLHDDGITTSVQELTLVSGDRKEWILTPKANQKMTVTIAWTDPSGTPVADALDPLDLMLVNDLDLKIIDEAGNETLPWILDPGIPSLGATKGNNYRDNIEKIEFEFPLAKPYRLVVNHKKELAGGMQDFSLILTYQSTATTAQTFYWVGDEGNWNDPAHWSLNSGSVSANKTPGVNDNVIMDENSFNESGLNQINFPQNQSVASLLWITSKSSGISLNTNKITVSKSFTIASGDFHVYSPGSIQCTSSQVGELNFVDAGLELLDVNINAGTWTISGSASLNRLIFEEGNLDIKNARLKLTDLTINSVKTKSVNLIDSEIELTRSSKIDQSALKWNTINSALRVKSDPVIFDWKGVVWPGNFSIDHGRAIINGNNSFAKMELDGTVEFTGANKLDSLVINSTSDIRLAPGTNQVVGGIQIKSGSSTSISSTGSSAITFTAHKKYCFDNLQITNVEAKGIAVVNAGGGSALINSKGWVSQKCEDVLFADFSIRYPCANGLTEFTDASSGAARQWAWTFPGSVTAQGQHASFPFLSAGKYQVTLTVSNATDSNSFTREVGITTNSLQTNQVVVNSDELFSFNQAAAYQWYKNDAQLPIETKRFYSYEGQNGIYSVVTYDDNCNRISDKVAITGMNEPNSGFIKIYPNPADEDIEVDSHSKSVTIHFLDRFGRSVISQRSESGVAKVSVSNLSEGIYLIEVVSLNSIHRERIMIRHK